MRSQRFTAKSSRGLAIEQGWRKTLHVCDASRCSSRDSVDVRIEVDLARVVARSASSSSSRAVPMCDQRSKTCASSMRPSGCRSMTTMRPGHGQSASPIRRQRRREPQVMLLGRSLRRGMRRGTCAPGARSTGRRASPIRAAASTTLPRRRCVRASRAPAAASRTGRRASRRLALRAAPQSMSFAFSTCGGELQVRQPDEARVELAAQAMVVQRQQFLHEARLAQQRAQLARGLLHLDAADLARDAKVVRREIVAGEVRADALAQVDALADVDRQVVHAVEAIHAGAFGQSLQRLGRQLRRKARDLEQALHRLLDFLALRARDRASARSARWRAHRPAPSDGPCAPPSPAPPRPAGRGARSTRRARGRSPRDTGAATRRTVHSTSAV